MLVVTPLLVKVSGENINSMTHTPGSVYHPWHRPGHGSPPKCPWKMEQIQEFQSTGTIGYHSAKKKTEEECYNGLCSNMGGTTCDHTNKINTRKQRRTRTDVTYTDHMETSIYKPNYTDVESPEQEKNLYLKRGNVKGRNKLGALESHISTAIH